MAIEADSNKHSKSNQNISVGLLSSQRNGSFSKQQQQNEQQKY